MASWDSVIIELAVLLLLSAKHAFEAHNFFDLMKYLFTKVTSRKQNIRVSYILGGHVEREGKL